MIADYQIQFIQMIPIHDTIQDRHETRPLALDPSEKGPSPVYRLKLVGHGWFTELCPPPFLDVSMCFRLVPWVVDCRL